MDRGWRQEISDGGLTLLMRGLKYGFHKNLRRNRLSSSDGRASYSSVFKLKNHLPIPVIKLFSYMHAKGPAKMLQAS